MARSLLKAQLIFFLNITLFSGYISEVKEFYNHKYTHWTIGPRDNDRAFRVNGASSSESRSRHVDFRHLTLVSLNEGEDVPSGARTRDLALQASPRWLVVTLAERRLQTSSSTIQRPGKLPCGRIRLEHAYAVALVLGPVLPLAQLFLKSIHKAPSHCLDYRLCYESRLTWSDFI